MNLGKSMLMLLLVICVAVNAQSIEEVTSQDIAETGSIQNVDVGTLLGERVGIPQSRIKRKTGKKQNQKGKRGGRRNKDKTEISAAHIVVNRDHPSVVGKPLKTGERGELIAAWKYEDFGSDRKQKIVHLANNGEVTIKRGGLYMIYSQMTYYDRTGRWSHMVAVNKKPFIKCLASEWGIDVDPETNVQYNTIHQCYTSAVIGLKKGDKVGIYSMYPDRIMHEDTEMCFWGLVKLTS